MPVLFRQYAAYSFVFVAFLGCAPAARDLSQVASVTKQGDAIQSMLLRGPELTDAELLTIGAWPTLTKVTLTECTQITSSGMSGFAKLEELADVTLIRVAIGDDGLKHLQSAELKSLSLAYVGMSGAGLATVSPSLESLKIHSATLTEEGVASIAHFANLRALHLDVRRLTVSHLPKLDGLTNLKSIDFGKTKLGAAGLSPLQDHPAVEKLKLSAEDSRNNVFAVLSSMKKLRELGLNNSQITDAGLNQFTSETLETLSLAGCEALTDQALGNLTGLPNLKRLTLTDSGVEGRDLTPLAALKSLEYVEFAPETFKGGKAAIAELKKLLPDCEVAVVGG